MLVCEIFELSLYVLLNGMRVNSKPSPLLACSKPIPISDRYHHPVIDFRALPTNDLQTNPINDSKLAPSELPALPTVLICELQVRPLNELPAFRSAPSMKSTLTFLINQLTI